MNRRLLIYIGVVVLMVVLIILSIVFANPYRVYLISSDETAYVFSPDAATTVQLRDPATVPITPAPQKEMVFAGQNITLQYSKSLSHEMNAYITEDNKVTGWFSTDDDKLRLVSAENWLSLPEKLEITESDYLNWIYQQVSAYYAENWEIYTKACTTTILSTASGIPEQIERNGFVDDGEQETVIAYTFTFTRYLGDYETSDMIQAYIRPDNGFVAMSFSAHNFDSQEPIAINMGKLENAVKKFLRNSIDKSKYTYISHELRQTSLSIVEGRLCFVCTVSIQIASEWETENVLQQLLVTLE